MMDREATPTNSGVPLRAGDFACLAEAMEYAARGRTGHNFYGGRGELSAVVTYAELREKALGLARRLLGLGLERGARVALVAEAGPEFSPLFFACQYAGLVPVPLPASLHLGGERAYVGQLRRLLEDCQAAVAVAPPSFLPYVKAAADGLGLRFVGEPDACAALPPAAGGFDPLGASDLAYLQYTSGTTRAVRAVAVTQRALMDNLRGILGHGIDIRPGDRSVSWLPYYHDMGFVGFVLAPIASQVSVDYLSALDFAKRPQLWLALMTQGGASISFSPAFGYELCARRLRPEDTARFQLGAWRVAGVGAEMIHPRSLERFAELLAPAGFAREAFVPCYGMAECSLAVSFAPLAAGIAIDRVDRRQLAASGVARPVDGASLADEDSGVSTFVSCGVPLPGFEIEVRDDAGRVLGDRQCGTIFLRGASVMSGYFGNPEVTREVLSPEGWLDTGDTGYLVDGSLVITGRTKDLIIIKGRNIWPQDLEFIAKQQPEVRSEAAAFSVPGPDGEETAVMVVQCRLSSRARRAELVRRLQALVREEFGINCFIELVSPRTLPRTSSGKLSRAGAREGFLARMGGRPVDPTQAALGPAPAHQAPAGRRLAGATGAR